MSTTELSMTSGNPYKLIITFAIPLMIGNIFQQLYNTADTLIVGYYLGDTAIAAVGVGFPFLLMMISFFMGIGIATNVIVAQYYGAKEYDKLNDTLSTIYLANIMVGVPITILGYFMSEFFLHAINVPNDGTLMMSKEYLQILFLGVLGNIGFNTNLGVLQGLGDSKSNLKFLIISTITNIILDIIFVGPLHMGIKGAAIATVIAQILSFVLGTIFLNNHYEYFNLNPKAMTFNKDIFKRMLRIGMPAAVQNMVFSLGVIVFQKLINAFGSAFIAGYTAANKLDAIIFFVLQSITNAMTTYTGQNVGAKKMDRIRSGLRAGIVLTLIASFLTGFFVIIFATQLLSFFVTSQEALDSGLLYIKFVVPVYFLMGLLFAYNAVLRGLGKSMVPMIASLISLWVARVPIAYFIVDNFGRDYMYISFPIGWILGVFMSAGYYYIYEKRWDKDLL